MDRLMFHGSIPALVTPMNDDRSIDFDALKALTRWHIDAGSSALVVCGTTGESATLALAEQKDILSTVLGEAAGRIPVIAGTGSPDTQKAIEATLQAESLGAAAALVVTPYYLRTSQQGLIEHYKAIANETSLPVILYNVPGRTGVDLLPETALQLSEVKNIVGIKEATGDIERVRLIKKSAPDFLVLSGDDGSAHEAMLNGAEGVISVTSNVVPEQMAALCLASTSDSAEKAQAMQEKLLPIHDALFVEPSPIPLKFVLSKLGKIQNNMRLPLVALSKDNESVVMNAYKGVTS